MSIVKTRVFIQQIIWAYLPVVLWAGVIFVFSSQSSLPKFEASVYDYIFKKISHIFVYLILYLLAFRAVSLTVAKTAVNRILFLPIIICLLYAVTDEFHQSLVPGRYATIRDIGYDMLGVYIAFLKKYNYI